MLIDSESAMSVFFFNDTATTEIYTLSLHDALPICPPGLGHHQLDALLHQDRARDADRKSTRLNSSHLVISYAVFCLKKKNRCSSIRHSCSATCQRSTRRIAAPSIAASARC